MVTPPPFPISLSLSYSSLTTLYQTKTAAGVMGMLAAPTYFLSKYALRRLRNDRYGIALTIFVTGLGSQFFEVYEPKGSEWMRWKAAVGEGEDAEGDALAARRRDPDEEVTWQYSEEHGFDEDLYEDEEEDTLDDPHEEFYE